MGFVRITLVRSPIGYPERQRRVLCALGLKKLNSSVIRENVPTIQGMVKKVSHLVSVVPVGRGEGDVKE